MILLYLIFTAAMLAPVYLLWQIAQAHDRRLKALEAKREQERRVVAPVQAVQPIHPPIENFTPKKPETLRPNQVRGREVMENVYEFDSKM